MDFYSARLLYICLVDDGRPKKRNHYDAEVFVIRARDAKHAFQRALEIGREHEHTYKNVDGQDVRWALVEITELNHVGRKVDGEEVSSELFHRVSPERIGFRKTFLPEWSSPRGLIEPMA